MYPLQYSRVRLLMAQDYGNSLSYISTEIEQADYSCFYASRGSVINVLPHPLSRNSNNKNNNKNTPWPQSVSELYRPSDRCLLANLVPTFANRGYCVVSTTDPYGRILGFQDRSPYYFFQVVPQLYSRGCVDPVLDPLLSENLVVPGIEPGTSGFVARNSGHQTAEAVRNSNHTRYF
jgi:hypothetical protein